MEKSEKNIMHREPRNAKDGIFAGGMGFDIAYQGIIITILTLLAYFIGHFIESGNWEVMNSPDGMTMAFLTLSMVEIFHSFNMRSRRDSIFTMPHHNKFLWGAMILSFILTTAVIYVPFLSDAPTTAPGAHLSLPALLHVIFWFQAIHFETFVPAI
jgi:Ca2+-transporting ATPase